MTGRVVLILTHPDDVHADAVEKHLLDAGVPVWRADTAGVGVDVPLVAYLGGDAVRGRLAGCDLAEVACVWHRRPGEPAATDPAGAAELRAAIGGVLAGLPHLNHPADMAVAALKPYQLVAAARNGLRVPETVVSTSDRPAVTLAQRHHGWAVVKPLARGAGSRVAAGDRSGWSRPVHLTQQQVDKSHDIRLTVVDDRLFPVRIDSPQLDWRTEPGACRYAVVESPAAVAAGVRRLMGALRLRYAALDFSVDRTGQWWFLEINPNGQWLWLEKATGAAISRAVAGALSTSAADLSH